MRPPTERRRYDSVFIAGCSRAGAAIASLSSARGKDVVVLDKDDASFCKLSPGYSGFNIVADVSDIDVLRETGMGRFDIVFAATNDDNVNVMVAQIASRIFHVPLVITKLYDPDKAILYQGYDVHIIYPTKLTAIEFGNIVSSDNAGENG